MKGMSGIAIKLSQTNKESPATLFVWLLHIINMKNEGQMTKLHITDKAGMRTKRWLLFCVLICHIHTYTAQTVIYNVTLKRLSIPI